MRPTPRQGRVPRELHPRSSARRPEARSKVQRPAGAYPIRDALTFSRFLGEELLKPADRVLEKRSSDGVVLRVLIARSLDAVPIEQEDGCAWIRQQQRRVRRNDELTASLHELMDAYHQGELPLRRQSGFWLIQNEQTPVVELVDCYPEERLAVRHLV